MRFMFAKFKEDFIIEDLFNSQLDVGYGGRFIPVSFMAKYNRLDLLVIVFSETDQFNEYTDFADVASKYGNLNIIKYLSAQGVKFESDLAKLTPMEYAAENGHLEVLKWLHLNRSEG